MADSVQVGKGVVFGIASATGRTIAITGVIGLLDSVKVARKGKIETLEDADSNTAAKIGSDSHLEGDFVWQAAADSRENARAGAALLPLLAKVTITDFALDYINGDWLYEADEAIDLTHKTAKLQFKLRKWDDPDQNTALTTIIEG